MPDKNPETLYYHRTTRKVQWICKYCSKRYTLNGGTRIIKLHLISAHEISEISPRQERALKRQRTIEEATIAGQNDSRKRRLITSNTTSSSKYITLSH